MVIKSLDAVLGDFNLPETQVAGAKLKPITVWIPEEKKLTYDELQQKSSRQFGKKVIKELIIMAIDKADKKVS